MQYRSSHLALPLQRRRQLLKAASAKGRIALAQETWTASPPLRLPPDHEMEVPARHPAALQSALDLFFPPTRLI